MTSRSLLRPPPPRRRVPTAVAALVLGLAALSACGGDDDGEGSPPPEVPTSLNGLPAEDDATETLTDALTGLRVGNTGTFDATYLYADQTFVYTGVYRLSPAEQRLTFVADLGEAGSGTPIESETISDAGQFFVRLPADGDISSDCWVVGEPAAITAAVGVEFNPEFEQLPGVVVLASTAVGIAEDTTTLGGLLGSVDLTTAMQLISPRLPGLLGLSGEERVLARITVRDELLVRIRIERPALLDALAEADVSVDRAELERVFAAEAPIDVTYGSVGSKVVVEIPDPADTIDLDAPDAQQRVDDCTA